MAIQARRARPAVSPWRIRGPTVVSVTITSNQAREFNTSTLTCSGVANDPDGGTPTFSFVWSHNGTDVGTGNTLALDTTNYAPTDSITCTATASDVHGGSDSDTETVTVKNRAPTVTRVTLSKTAGVLTGDTLRLFRNCDGCRW